MMRISHRLRYTVIALSFMLIPWEPVRAWNEAGHRIIASIAYRGLTGDERRAVAELLEQHPRFAGDFQGRLPDGLDPDARTEWFFQQAAIWPDLTRGYSPDLKPIYHRGPWHYINLPHFLSDEDRRALDGRLSVHVSLEPPAEISAEMNAVQALRVARRLIKDHRAPAADRALMLTWLCHLVGDLHQPLHSTALFSRKLYPEGDHGGNLVHVVQHGNLHALWDSLPGRKVEFRDARNEAIRVLRTPPSDTVDTKSQEDATWLDESHALAVDVVYDAEVLTYLRKAEADPGQKMNEAFRLSDDYLRRAGAVSDLRLLQAGCRLARILKNSLSARASRPPAQ